MRSSLALRALLAVTLLVGVAGVHAQNINVTAANASNDAIYSVTFNNNGGGSILVLNQDGGSLHSLTSLVFLLNPSTFALDLFAADNAGGLIVRYPGDFHTGAPKTGSVVFPNGGAAGPANPDGLSVDGAGDLFVVNSKSGSNSNPQLWVLPPDGAGGFLAPVQLIDTNGYASTQVLEETLVVPTTITLPGLPQLNPGDLLVLSSNPSLVLQYSATAIAACLSQQPIPATCSITSTTLITLASGSVPGGIAFWPADNTLLVSDSRGTISQFDGPTPNPTPFANGLGNGQFKIKTGTQLAVPYAYVANNNGGQILEFAGPQINGKNQLSAVVTSGVQHPQGLAVTNVNYTSFSNCQLTNTCDVLGGGVIRHNVAKSITSNNIVEDICVVPVDPRLPGGCTTPLPVSQVCHGFSNTIVIPASLCGTPGFALVKTLVNASAQQFNGSLVSNDSNPSLNGQNNPNACLAGTSPVATLAWAPLNVREGIVIEGNNLLEVTSDCDNGGGGTRALSMFGVGFEVNVPRSGLASYATTKYVNLSNPTLYQPPPANQPVGTVENEIAGGALLPPTAPSDTTGQSSSVDGNVTYLLQQCIATSQLALNAGATSGSALDALTADQLVADNLGYFTATPSYPNPSGELRWRLQNLYYTLNTRIGGNQASSQVPSPPYAAPAPSITGTPVTNIKAGMAYSFQVPVTGTEFFGALPPGTPSTLTFSITGQPSWASFSTTTGQLSGTTVKGTYGPIVISVTDGCTKTPLKAFTIKVTG